jgi:hypothetical protein
MTDKAVPTSIDLHAEMDIDRDVTLKDGNRAPG